MEDAHRSWLALLDDLPRRIVLLLAGSPEPVSGRRVADALGVSPTTASATLHGLNEHGLVRWRPAGRAKLWELDVADPRVRQLLEEEGPETGPRSARVEDGVRAALALRPPTRTAVVLTALSLEYAAIREHLQDVRLERTRHGTRFEVGQVTGESLVWNVAIAEIGMGNASAAAEVGPAIELFEPDLLLFVGVAGSVKPADVRLGDVIVADRVYNLHAGKVTGADPDAGHLSRPLSFPTSHRLVQLVRAVCRSSWADTLLEPGVRAAEQGPPRNDTGARPRAQVRAIAAGEVVLASERAALRQLLTRRFNDAAAVEMESAGLYETAHRHDGLPALAIRGISDTIEDKSSSKDAHWQPRAAAHAAAFAVALLRQADPEDLRPSRSAPTHRAAPTTAVPATKRDSTASMRRTSGGKVSGQPSRTRVYEALDRLPPTIADMHTWARRHDRAAADRAVIELAAHTQSPTGWLGRVRHRPSIWLRDGASAAKWALLAVFAEAYESSHAYWAFVQAAGQAASGLVQAVLLCRAGLADARAGHREEAHRTLTQAQAREPSVTALATAMHAIVDDDVAGLLRAAVVLAPTLGVHLPVRALDRALSSPATTTAKANESAEREAAQATDSRMVPITLDRELAENAPELLADLQVMLAMHVGVALRALGEPVAALQVFRAIAANTHVSDAATARNSQTGSRAAGPLLEEARTLLATVTGLTSVEPAGEMSTTLRRAAELALVARDRRRDWNGSAGDALAIAGHARALAGDLPAALRLLLPPPQGTATATEATHPEVLDVAAMAAHMSGNSDLVLRLAASMTDQVKADLTTGLAYAATPGCHDLAVAAFKRVLAHADQPEQQFRALFGLSRLGEKNDAALGALAEHSPYAADIIRAIQHIGAGRYDEALLLTRRYPRSISAVELTVDALVSSGRSAEAIEILETAGRRHGDEGLFLHAATLALQGELLDDAERLARIGIDSADPRVRRSGRHVLLDVATRRGNWDEVVDQTRRLLEDTSTDHSDSGYGEDESNWQANYRWALVTALTNQRRHAEALRAMEQPTPLESQNPQQAILSLHLLHHALTETATLYTTPADGTRSALSGHPGDRDSVEPILRLDGTVNRPAAIARAVRLARAFPEDEAVGANALMLVLTTPIPPQLPADTLAQLRRLQEDFFSRFPSNRYLQRIRVGEDLSELTSFLRASVESRTPALTDLAHRVWLGIYPVSLLAEATGRGYAESLIKCLPGCLVIAGADPDVEEAERRAAMEARGGAVVVDTSTLVLLGQVLDDPQRLLAHFGTVLASATLRDDALRTRGMLVLRGTGTLSWDPKHEQPVLTEYDRAQVEAWADAAVRLVDRFIDCAVVSDPPIGAADGEDKGREWHASLTLAAHRNVPLLADDFALRTVARAQGVVAFGSLELLRALAETDSRIVDDADVARELPHVEQRLRAIRALDIGTPTNSIPEMAAEDRFDPNGTAALLLAHPAAWHPADIGFAAYAKIIRSTPDLTVDQVAGWCAAAISGLAWATVPAARPRAIGALMAWTVLNTGGSSGLAKALHATSSLLAYLLPDADALSHAVNVLAETLETVLPVSRVPAVLLRLLADLPKEAHTRAVHAFLTRRS